MDRIKDCGAFLDGLWSVWSIATMPWSWSADMVEASAVIEIDFTEKARTVSSPDLSAFFDRLACYVKERNPDMFEGETS